MGKSILITGAAGFIGAHVVEHLLKNSDFEIKLLDKLTYASNGLSRLQDTKTFQHESGRVHMFAVDISQPISWGVSKEIGQANYILHMAAETHVDNSIADPWPFVQANVIGTFHMLEFARRCNMLEKFLYFSTDEVFGPAAPRYMHVDDEEHAYKQGLELLPSYQEWDRYNSTNPYSATKAAGEELCLAWSNTYRIPGMMITHTMNNFGERQHPEKFIPTVVRKLLAEEKIHVHADASKTKSGSRFYIHARNTADAVLFLLNKAGLERRDKFNIVGEKEVTNLDLVNSIHAALEKIMGRSIDKNVELTDFHSSRPGHDLRYALDGSKMKSLGWAPPNTFEESLEKTVRWMVDPSNLKWLLMKHQTVGVR